jgi:hypothetical protein
MKKLLFIILIPIVFGCETEKRKIKNVGKKIEQNEKSRITKGSVSEIIIASSENGIKIDTLLSFDNNIQIRIKKTDLTASFKKSDFELKIDSTLKEIDNAHRWSIKKEKILIKKYDSLVRKDSIGLHLKIKGKWKLIELHPEADEIEHTFDNYFVDENLFFIRTQWGEGNGYTLINKKTGKKYNTLGEPYFSKNKEFIVSTNVDLVAEYTETGFDFFKKVDENLLFLGTYKSINWGPQWAKGISNNTFIVKCHKYDEDYNISEFFIELEFIEK